MKYTKLITTVAIAASFALPLATLAATFEYVDVNGNISAVDAASAAQALTVNNLAPASGVMLVTGGSVIMTGFVPVSAGTYEYVDVNGNISSVAANSAAQALTVSNLAPSSGVMLIAH